ncbi:hypothetical protein [Microbacterium sp. 16-032]|uniref:hypothetical protein n=1 Tax=Microbacterium sp. 16-032 TaxID=3239808 RepID=UPI0034E2C576
MPRWFMGGSPKGLETLCGWQLALQNEADWIWEVQTVETVSGTIPSLVNCRRLTGASAEQSESLYDALLDLQPRDHLQPTTVWDLALFRDARLVTEEGRTFALSLRNVRELIMSAPTAETLRVLMPQLVTERLRPALPRSSVWFIDTPNDWLPSRFAVARALLRGLERPDAQSPMGSHFRSSQYLFNDTTLGLGAFLTPLFTSLTPEVWGYTALRVGGVVAFDFGELIHGDAHSKDRLLRHFSSRDREGDPSPSKGEAPRRRAYSAAIKWWCERLNLLFAEATNLANYANREGILSPAMLAEKLLSLEQFFRHCESLATSRDDPHSSRVMLFMALETLAGIAPGLGHAVTYDLSKVEVMMAKVKEVMPGGVQALLLPRAERAVEALRAVADGFFVKSRRPDPEHVILRADNGELRPVPTAAAVKLWLRVLRNSHHGFDKEQGTQTRDLLAIHDGRFPEPLSDLAWLFLLYLLTFPRILRRARSSAIPSETSATAG